MRWLRRLICKHDYEFVRNIYGDEINHVDGRRSWWRCKKCGKWIARDELNVLVITYRMDGGR